MSKKRIAIAGFQHETNTFCPFKTSLGDFEHQDAWPALTKGSDVIDVFKSLNIPIGGFISSSFDWDLIPIVWASAEPAGPVSNEAFDAITELICTRLQRLSPIDGVLLDLHGAMVTEGFDDGELEIVRRVRRVIGDSIPLVCSLDYHANISQEFIDIASAVTIFRHYPHTDMAETGARAAKLLDQLLQNGKPFDKSFMQIDYLIPLSSQGTTMYPFDQLYSGFVQLETDGVLSVDAAAGFTSADIYNCGASVLAYGTDQKAVDQAVNELHQRFERAEENIVDQLLTPKQAIQNAVSLLNDNVMPVVLADVQDNPGAGATSDTTGILEELIRQDSANAIVGIINDPQNVEKCTLAGIGAELELELGNVYQIEGASAFPQQYEVQNLTDKPVLCTGEMYGGCESDLGAMALLKVSNIEKDIYIVLSSQRFQCLDLAPFRHMGLTIEKPQIIVVKSTVHFLADFEPIAQKVYFVQSPGVNPCRLDEVEYKKLRPGVRIGPLGKTIYK